MLRLRPSVLPERSKSIMYMFMKSTAKTLIPYGPRRASLRSTWGAVAAGAPGGAAGQAWLRAAVPKKEVFFESDTE